MLRLHYSNRLEELVPPLADEIEQAQRRDPLARVTIVVPNRAIEEFLKLRVAERLGVAANLGFPFLRSYLARVLAQAEPDLRVLEAEELELAIFECLRRQLAGRASSFEPVRRYLADFDDSGERELRLFELGVRVARLFREYSISRPALLSAWRRARAAEVGDFAEAERWQRALYGELFGGDGALRAEWLSAGGRRWMLLPDAIAAADSNRLASTIGGTLHVFGLSYVGLEFIKIFGRLGKLVELHIYTLNPCAEFWEDVANVEARAGLVRHGAKLAGALEDAEDPFALGAAADNLALQFWGRPGREYIRLLNELTDCDFDSRFVDPAAGAPRPTLLWHLQSSIMNRRADPSPRSSGAGIADDKSIRFLACPGIRREVEIVSNAICQLLGEDEASGRADRLRVHHVAVLIPDGQTETYMPHIETVLAEQYRIPINVVNVRFNAQSRVGEAVELLLGLPDGRFSRDEVLHVLTHPAVSAGIAAADPEQWRAWCRSLGIVFGADARDFENTYLPPYLFNWDQALKRLALGIFMAGEPSGVVEIFRAPPEHEYLPYETAPDTVQSVAAMLSLARRILADAVSIRSARLELGEWAELLAEYVGAYVHPEDAADEAVLDECLSALASLGSADLRVGKVPYRVAREIALARVAGAESRHGRYAERGVVVGSLSALRSIPFRVVFMLGLGESLFPERDRRDPLDLRLVRRRAGDVSAAERDRYLFLETILAARERIFFSWVSRDPQTGDSLEPSPLLRELQFILRGWVDEQTLSDVMTVKHPVSPYDLRYFPDLPQEDGAKRHPEMLSFDPDARRGARMAALRRDLQTKCEGAKLPARGEALLGKLADGVQDELKQVLRVIEPSRPEPLDDAAEISLPLAALVRFLECPLQGAVRYALGIADEDGDAEADEEDEPLEESALARTMLVREAFWLGRGDLNDAHARYNELFRISQLRGAAPVGPFEEVARETDQRKLELCVEQARRIGIANLEGWQKIQLGSASELARVDHKMDALVLEIPARGGKVRRRVKLNGIVGPISPRLDCSFLCISRNKALARNFLGGFLGALVLCAAGKEMASVFTGAVLGGEEDGEDDRKFTRKLQMPTRNEACKYLSGLVEDLLSGNNHYFLPIEAVEAIVRGKTSDGQAPADIARTMRDNQWAGCSSDHGPVRNARKFDPPGNDEIKAIIERRFGPIRSIFNLTKE